MKFLRYLAIGLCATSLSVKAQLFMQPMRYQVNKTAKGSAPDNKLLVQNAMVPGGDSSGYAEAITPDIQSLADGLQDDPLKIFNYVHDHIKFVLYYGSLKGAELTLLEQSGNDFDQCALLVALLEAAGYSPSYGFGMLQMPYQATDGTQNDLQHWLQLSVVNDNWDNTTNYFGQLLGQRGYPVVFYMGDNNSIAFQRVWVTVTIGGTNYVLDPAFKVSEPISSQVNLAAAMGVSSNALMAAAAGIDTGNYVTNLNETNVRGLLTGYTTNLLNYMQSNCPNASVDQVLGGWQIVPSTNAELSQTLLFSTFTDNNNYPLQTWSTEPTNYMSAFSMTFAGTNQSWFFPQLEGQGLSLNFETNGTAQLWLGTSLILQTTNTGTGQSIMVTNSVTHPFGGWDLTNNVPVDLGGFDQTEGKAYQRTNANYAIMYCFEPSVKWLNKQEQQLDEYIALGYSNTAPEVVNSTLNVIGMEWMVQTALAHDLFCKEEGQLPEFNHRIGRMSQEIGFGYYVDIYMQDDQTFPATGAGATDIQNKDQVFNVSSYVWSAMEHAIIQQMQSSNLLAVSTVKLLQIANTNKMAIYLINSNNWSSISNQLTNYGGLMSGFNEGIGLGFEFLLPQSGSIAVAGSGSWTGNAFIQWYSSAQGQVVGMAIGGGQGGFPEYPSMSVSPPWTQECVVNQPSYFIATPAWTPAPLTADPVDTADDTFQLESTDLSLGQAEPHGITLSRYYNGTRRLVKTSGMPYGWVQNYCVTANNVPAPQAGLGETTPAQMAPMLVTTIAALNLYNGIQPDPKNWVVTALIAKWGVDQLIKNGVSVNLGKDSLQFVQQPNGVFTPPANCTSTLTTIGSTYVLQMRHGNKFNFNASGLLTTITDPYNNTPLTVTYGSSNLVSQVTDWKSRDLVFKYNSVAELTNVTDSSGRSISYGYSTNYSRQGDLTLFTDAAGHATTYTYDTNHDLVATIDPQGRMVVSNVYNGDSQLAIQCTEGDTNKTWTIFYSGYNTTEFDPAGDEQIYTYDDQGRLISNQDALGNLTQTFYDGQNHVIETVSPLDETNLYFYDGNNNVTSTTDPLGFVTSCVYDSSNNLVQVINPRGNVTLFGYNAQFSLTGETNGAGEWKHYIYNSTGTLASSADAGETNTYTYDTWNQVASITYFGSLGSESFKNSVLGDVTNHTDGRGFNIVYKFDALRQLTNTIAPTNVVSVTAYDAEGNTASTTDPRGNVVSETWSATRELLATTLPPISAGTPVTTNIYDNREWLTEMIDALGNPTFSVNDPDDRLIAQTDPLQRTTAFTYDGDGRKLLTVNAASETNSQTWDAKGEMLAMIDGAGHTSIRGYDAAGNQIALTNRNGKVWHFYFDGANRMTNMVSPLGRSTMTTYNLQGLVAAKEDASGNFTTYSYDAKERLTNRSDSVGTTIYRYDPSDNRTNITENGLTNSWTYDAYNRVSSYSDVYGHLIQYRYDAAGNLTNLVYPGGKNVYYSYDAENHMTKVTDWSGRVTTMTYDLNGRVTGLYRPNGTSRTIVYDSNGDETNIFEQTASGTPIALFRYNWNPAEEMGWEFAAPLPHTASLPTRTMTYDADDELQTVDGNSVSLDPNGNLLSGPLTNDAFATYAYDARNRLTSAGGVTNLYDAANNRIGQFYGTNSMVYVVNPNAKLPQVLMRIRNGITNYYVYGPGLLYQVTEQATGTNTLTYHYDYRGSTIALTDDGGNVKDRFEYSLYATLTYSVGSDNTPFLFNGRYGVMTDPNSLLYMEARYYSPFICRFLDPDPSGFSGGMNFYVYANGNPVSYLDPFGLWSWTQTAGVARAFGGAFEAVAGYSLAVASAGVGAATSWTGVGLVAGAGGVIAGGAVGLHGLDQLQAGIRQAFSGNQVDSITSEGLQAAGMSQNAANLTDAGISIVGSLGAGSATTAVKLSAIYASDPLAQGMNATDLITTWEKGSQALNDADYWGMGGDATSPLYKAAAMDSWASPLTTTPWVEFTQSLKLAGTGLTPLGNFGFGVAGEVGGVLDEASWLGNSQDLPNGSAGIIPGSGNAGNLRSSSGK